MSGTKGNAMSDPHGMNAPDARPVEAAWWKNWDNLPREELRGIIEANSGAALAHNDPLPDTLIAAAQALGMFPFELRFFARDEPARATVEAWSVEALTVFARRYDMDRTAAFAETRAAAEALLAKVEGGEGKAGI